MAEKISGVGLEKVKVVVNQVKLDELLNIATNGPFTQDTLKRAEGIAVEAFGGYSPGIKDNTTHFALYDKDRKCVGASSKVTSWYNPNVDWPSVHKAVEALWTIQEKIEGGKIIDRGGGHHWEQGRE